MGLVNFACPGPGRASPALQLAEDPARPAHHKCFSLLFFLQASLCGFLARRALREPAGSFGHSAEHSGSRHQDSRRRPGRLRVPQPQKVCSMVLETLARAKACPSHGHGLGVARCQDSRGGLPPPRKPRPCGGALAHSTQASTLGRRTVGTVIPAVRCLRRRRTSTVAQALERWHCIPVPERVRSALRDGRRAERMRQRPVGSVCWCHGRDSSAPCIQALRRPCTHAVRVVQRDDVRHRPKSGQF